MKLVIQRVTEASVKVSDKVVGSIQCGLMVLLGVHSEDTEEDAHWLVKKLISMRIFSDDDNKMNRSITDIKGSLLIISQFTLYSSTKKGNRPSYIHSARPEKAKALYEYFIDYINSQSDIPVETGIFAADMKVQLVNDGPVTIIIDSRNKE